MTFKEAQNDMRRSYLGGSTGIFFSGVVWLVAGITATIASNQTSIIVFFFGGMLIHPMGVSLSKAFNRSGKHQVNNPFAKLALESTMILFVGLFISYSIFLLNPIYFFAIMLMIIGCRYVLFQTIYGIRLYWILGLILALAGAGCLITNQPFHIGAIAGGVIELIFAFLIFKFEKVPNQ